MARDVPPGLAVDLRNFFSQFWATAHKGSLLLRAN